MALSYISGFGLHSLGEFKSTVGSGVSISTSVSRTGTASLEVLTSSAPTSVTIQKIPSGGVATAFAQSWRVYIRIDNFQFVTCNMCLTGSTAAATQLIFLTSFQFRIADGAGGGATDSTQTFASLINDGLFHRFDVVVSGTTRSLYIDGVLVVQSTTGGTAAPQTSLTLGSTSSSVALTCYYADLSVDDGAGAAPVSGANNKCLLLLPTAGNNAGGWTNGAGGTGDIHGSVANIPPVGVLASTAAAKIKNATSTTTGDFVATMQSYIAAGIPPGSTINAVAAVSNDGVEVTTGGAKPGAIWIASNPAQTAGTGTFDYGDNGVIEGTFPTGWAQHQGVVAVAPSVTLSTAPTVTVRKNLASTRVVGVDFMGLYVDYTPPPIGQIVNLNQSVNRASFF